MVPGDGQDVALQAELGDLGGRRQGGGHSTGLGAASTGPQHPPREPLQAPAPTQGALSPCTQPQALPQTTRHPRHPPEGTPQSPEHPLREP